MKSTIYDNHVGERVMEVLKDGHETIKELFKKMESLYSFIK